MVSYRLALPERLLDKLRRSAVSPFIRTLRELNVDFLGKGSQQVHF
jgi:hypothetical protein